MSGGVGENRSGVVFDAVMGHRTRREGKLGPTGPSLPIARLADGAGIHDHPAACSILHRVMGVAEHDDVGVDVVEPLPFLEIGIDAAVERIPWCAMKECQPHSIDRDRHRRRQLPELEEARFRQTGEGPLQR